MRKFVSLLLAALFFVGCMPIGNATEYPNDVDEELMLETVVLDGKTIVIPAVVQHTEIGMNTYSAFDAETALVAEQITYYIPLTEEDQEYNREYVEYVRAAGSSGSSTITQSDPKRYFKVTSTIQFTTYPSADGRTPDFLVSIDNVALTRTNDPIGTEWDILDVDDPSVRILQIGYSEDPNHNTMDQEVQYDSVEWGSQGVDTPSDWYPVVCGSYSDGYRGLAQWAFDITYSAGGKQTCRITHTLAI